MMKFFKRKLPAFLLALAVAAGMVPAASAASADIEYSVKAGKSVTFDAEDFDDLESFYYLEFTGYDDLDRYGSLVSYDKKGGKVTLDEDDLKDTWFYYDEDEIYHDSDCDLDRLSFVADDNVKGTLELDFDLYDRKDSRKYSGKLEITISGASSSGSSRGDAIVYEVDANDEVDLDADDFNDLFQDEYGSGYDMRYLVFDKPDSDAFEAAELYDEYEDKTFTRSNLSNYEFYYSSSSYGDYDLDDLVFSTERNFKDDVELSFTIYGSGSREVDGSVLFTTDAGSKDRDDDEDGDIEYEVDPGDEVEFDEDDFEEFYSDNKSGNFAYLEFTKVTNLSSSTGVIYCDYRSDSKYEKKFSSSSLKSDYFYYGRYDDQGDYALDDLSFVADTGFKGTVVLEFRAYSTSDKSVDGTLVIRSSKVTSSKGSITYQVAPNANQDLSENDFYKFYDQYGGSGSLKYVTFPDTNSIRNPGGVFYVGQDLLNGGNILSWDNLDDYRFYYSSENFSGAGYTLNDLHFSAGQNFATSFSLTFRAWSSSSSYVDGTLTFKPGTGTGIGGTAVAATAGDIMYSTLYNTNLQLNSNDFSRFLKKTYPSATLQYVKLGGVPSTGTLYYNYYNASSYGTAQRTALSGASVSSTFFYYSPTSASQYSLGELTFVPNNRANYCEAIPFTVYGSGSQTVSGTVLISVTLGQVSDVYGAIPKNTQVNFPALNIYNAVLSGTGVPLAGIRLLKLPSTVAGTVYVGSTYTRANTVTQYSYNTGTMSLSQLRFVPASTFTGSVEIPYVAYNSGGTAIATGKFCLGVLNAASSSTMKKFSDIPSTSWCYKYVTELSDTGVVGGYSDGSFKPDSSVTYGAALKLVMLAAGYPSQAAAGSSGEFNAYLTKAKADGLVSGAVNLRTPINRLQMAQLAAKALKLSTANLSTQKPFADSSDPYLQALNAAGIVEGYFNNGTYTYKPGNTLTRGQLSTIVWRMQQYRK